MTPAHDQPPIPSALCYHSGTHGRRHGPRGYLDDDHYKPWLRDEVEFRCVCCLSREAWLPDGLRSFSVEHLVPRSVAAPGRTEYGSLIYACCQCNAHRGAAPLPFDPSDGLGSHLAVMADGTVAARTIFGAAFIAAFGLDRPELAKFRRRMIELLRHLAGDGGEAALRIRAEFLAYPDDLPDLSALRPPDGNTRPGGVAQSAFARRERGELPATY